MHTHLSSIKAVCPFWAAAVVRDLCNKEKRVFRTGMYMFTFLWSCIVGNKLPVVIWGTETFGTYCWLQIPFNIFLKYFLLANECHTLRRSFMAVPAEVKYGCIWALKGFSGFSGRKMDGWVLDDLSEASLPRQSKIVCCHSHNNNACLSKAEFIRN